MNERFSYLPEDELIEESKGSFDSPIDRIAREAGISNIVELIGRIPNTDFQSLLLEIMDRKSREVGIHELTTSAEKNPYVQASTVEQRIFQNFDSLAYSILPPDFRGVELPILVPFGTNSVLAGISQKRILSTTRNAEIISDPTTTLALLCAKERSSRIRRDKIDSEVVKLATSQRVVRQGQLKEDYSCHFRSFAIASAGKDIGHEHFEKQSLEEHLNFFLSLLRALNKTGNYNISDIEVICSDVTEKNFELLEIIDRSVVSNLRKRFPEVTFREDRDRKSKYYATYCYSILANSSILGRSISIGGGGLTNWTQLLTGSKKERYLNGAVGTETLCRYFIR